MITNLRQALAGLCVLLVGTAHAASVAVVSVSGGTDQNNGANFSLGWEFTVNYTVTVTELGFYDDLGDGLVDDHAVGIYSSGGTLLTSGTVVSSDALDGQFRYTDVADLVLTSGNTYYMMAVTGTVDKYNVNGTLSVHPAVNWVRNAYYSPPGGGVLAPPNFFDNPPGVTGYFGGGFKIDSTSVPAPVPIPAAGWFLGALGVPLAWARRRRRAPV